MNNFIILILTSAAVGLIHTVAGPDHYIPFIAIAKAKNWNLPKTNIFVVLCGIAHIFSSVLIALIGVALGIAINSVTDFESSRGDIAAWLMIGFGLAYLVWGIRKIFRNKSHTHSHSHSDGTTHTHHHSHLFLHSHIHEKQEDKITPWVLFLIFIFGPCEPLIPLVMYPLASGKVHDAVCVVVSFGLVTLSTMLGIVLVSLKGLKMISFAFMEKYTHVFAGSAILACGLAVKLLGL